jgi:RimJ/RimL family protein N-acetyltransferase
MHNLSYRNLGADDFTALQSIASTWGVVRQLGSWPWPADPAFTKNRCTPYAGDGFVWAICLDGVMCGSITVTGCELGYMLHPSVAGRGIMTAAARHAIRHGFATRDIACINASVWHDNAASHRVLTKLGFTHWQTRFEQSKARGIPTQCQYYRLRRTDWTA